MDTATGIGTAKAPVTAHATVNAQVTGRGAVPSSGVAAVVLNVTAASATARGYLTVFAHGGIRPPTANVNFVPGQTVPNLVVVPVGAGGQISIYNGSAGTVRIVADIDGYYLGGTPDAAGAFTALGSTRVLDTASGTGTTKAPLAAHATVDVSVTGRGGVPGSGVSAVLLNVTATAATARGYLTVFPHGETRPSTASVNFTQGQTVPNLVVVPVGADGQISVYNGSAGTMRAVADVDGYYLGGTPDVAGAFTTLGSARVLDTASGIGTTKTPVPAHGTINLQATGHGGVPASGVSAVVLNVTAASATARGYLTVFQHGRTRPSTANLNFVPDQTVPNLVVVPIGADGRISVYNGSAGTVRIVADLDGYYLSGPPAAPEPFTFTDLPAADLPQGWVQSLSCGGPSACVAGDEFGNIIDIDGQTASTPVSIGQFVSSVSCPSTAFCAASVGQAIKFRTASGWIDSGAVDIESPWSQVACTSSTFCVATDRAGRAAIYDGTWGSPVAITTSDILALSCASPTLCVAMDDRGRALMFTGHAWATSPVFDNTPSSAELSCSVAGTCLAGELQQTAYFDGTSWASPQLAPHAEYVADVSCPSASTCLLATEDGTTQMIVNGTIRTDGPMAPLTDLLACSTASNCLALANDPQRGDDAFSTAFDGSAWSATRVAETYTRGQVTSLSCPTAAFCGGVDRDGVGVIFDGTSWTDPVRLDERASGSSAPAAVSCPVVGWCLAVNVGGDATTYRNGHWQAPTEIRSGASLIAISCATTSFCVAIDNSRDAYTYDGSTWTPSTVESRTNDLSAISCPSAELCIVTGGSGEVVMLQSGQWQTPDYIDDYPYLTAISCANIRFCVAVDGNGRAFTYNGLTWSAPITIDGTRYLKGISCSSTVVCGAIDSSDTFIRLTSGGESVEQTPPLPTLSVVACDNSPACVVIGEDGQAVRGR